MKPRVMVISSLTVALMMILSTNALGIDLVMNLSASTNDSAYTIGEDVTITAEWDVDDNDNEHIFSHSWALVWMNISKQGSTWRNDYWGIWEVGDQRSGQVYVTCLYTDGGASYTWDTTGESPGTYWVDVEAHAWDNFSMVHYYVWASTSTATFTLSV